MWHHCPLPLKCFNLMNGILMNWNSSDCCVTIFIAQLKVAFLKWFACVTASFLSEKKTTWITLYIHIWEHVCVLVLFLHLLFYILSQDKANITSGCDARFGFTPWNHVSDTLSRYCLNICKSSQKHLSGLDLFVHDRNVKTLQIAGGRFSPLSNMLLEMWIFVAVISDNYASDSLVVLIKQSNYSSSR